MRSPVVLLVLTLAASAAVTPAGAHDWYHGLLSPSGVECCGDRDCRPVPYRLNADTGREEVEANGRWWPVEPDKVLTLPTPDGGAHACWDSPYGKPRFRCIILPGMARFRPSRPHPAAVVPASFGP